MGEASVVDGERLVREDGFEALVFEGLELQAAELGRKEFTGCVFRGCKLQETGWRGSRLEDCRFERCDLTRMQPRGMLAHDLHFSDCKLMGIEWTDLGQFPQLGFKDCVLDFASFVELSLRKTGFLGCKISEANFFDCDLREADFAGSELRGSVFRRCQLAKADFSAASQLFLDPAVNQARGARVAIEAAALLALHLGLEVPGFTTAAVAAEAGGGKRRGRAAR